MIQIHKGEEPLSFTHWKAQASEDWTPTYEGLQNPEKRELHQALVNEQRELCCYCGRRISAQDSHIEHFQPQSKRPDLALAYPNLHASCIRATSRGLPLHCGHLKDEGYHEQNAVFPTSECEHRFSYQLDGHIRGQDVGAVYMVDLLGLDIPFLTNRREEALAGVFDVEFLQTVTRPELLTLVQAFRQGNQEFRQVLTRYTEQLLNS
ncbi:MAG: TIGR02646 family protein [Candidatus Eremiobacteraeota bacterium]|nr:TIGR02646 family protein [Candidatus Eremiobacteraeota bacterium]